MTDRIGAYSPDVAKLVLEVVNHLKRTGLVVDGTQPKQYNAPPNTPIYFRNDTGETIPPFACLQATGTAEVDGQNYLIAKKPADTTGEAGPFFFNLFSEVGTGDTTKYGIGSRGPIARAKSSVVDFIAGAGFAPVVDSFSIIEEPGPFRGIGPDDLESDCIKVTIESAASAGTGATILFSLESTESSSQTNGGGDSEAAAEVLCADREETSATAKRAKILRRPCGSTSVYGEDNGYVTVVDDGGKFFDKRTDEELEGKLGFATLMGPRIDDTGAGTEAVSDSALSGSSSNGDCEWVITWINFFREKQVLQDWYVEGTSIVEELINVHVWNDCRLPDEITEGIDCETSSSTGGA